MYRDSLLEYNLLCAISYCCNDFSSLFAVICFLFLNPKFLHAKVEILFRNYWKK
jgi:hypothetical protein